MNSDLQFLIWISILILVLWYIDFEDKKYCELNRWWVYIEEYFSINYCKIN